MTDLGDCRYFVEYLDHAQGVTAIKAGGGDVDNDSMWDYCSQDEITVRKPFVSKWRAVEWAKRHKRQDVFHMPRIVEETYQERPGDRARALRGQGLGTNRLLGNQRQHRD